MPRAIVAVLHSAFGRGARDLASQAGFRSAERTTECGRLAQLGERRVRNAEVGSSSLLPSTTHTPHVPPGRAAFRVSGPAVIRLVPQSHRLAVCRLTPDSALAPWMVEGELWSLTRTRDELSVVVDATRVPAGVRAEGPFSVFMVAGPLDFGLTGILARLTAPLAEAGIPVFVVSTYDTDYVLVRSERAAAACAAWSTVDGIEIR